MNRMDRIHRVLPEAITKAYEEIARVKGQVRVRLLSKEVVTNTLPNNLRNVKIYETLEDDWGDIWEE